MKKLDLEKIKRIGVLNGGVSAEREISLQSGRAVIDACVNLGINVVDVDLVGKNIIDTIKTANIDLAFIALHGGIGEDGRLQSLLEMMNIPYTGSGVQPSVVAMNKLISKRIWQGIHLPTPDFYQLTANSDFKVILESLGGSAIVKPANEGSSIGMAVVKSADELQEAFEQAYQYDTAVFVEELLTGAEYTVGILNREVLPAIKLETDNVFYDYEAKYLSEDTRYIFPCGLSQSKEREIENLSRWAFDSLGCSGWGRVDLMMDANENFKVLEVNTVPGLTSHSLVPMAAKAAGYSFDELVLMILASVALPK